MSLPARRAPVREGPTWAAGRSRPEGGLEDCLGVRGLLCSHVGTEKPPSSLLAWPLPQGTFTWAIPGGHGHDGTRDGCPDSTHSKGSIFQSHPGYIKAFWGLISPRSRTPHL